MTGHLDGSIRTTVKTRRSQAVERVDRLLTIVNDRRR